MNSYLKSFLQRGVVFGGLGPIITGIVFAILELTLPDFSLGGVEVLLAIVSTYLLAFTQAGASVFNQIEHWPVAKSLLCHFGCTYLGYLGCYLVNSWIPFEPMVIVIFSAIFAVVYLAIWLSIYFAIRATRKKLNQKISK